MCRRAVSKPLALTIVSLCLFATAAAASSHETVCEEFDRKHRIHRMGGRAAFSKTPVTSPADLAAQLEAHRAEVEAVMAERGLGHLTEALYAAVESGEGLSERDLERGEVFDWMVFRKRSGPTAAGPMCLKAKKTYDAYVITVTEEEAHPAKAACALKATAGECVENEIMVDAGGSSPGVEVKMTGPGGGKTVISGGSTSWKGLPQGAGTYTFTAMAKATGSKTVTTHTFVIPKVCLNLAYSGKSSEKMAGAVDSCQQTASVTVADCKPSCDIRVSPPQVDKKETVTVDVSGKWDAGGISVEVTDPKGQPFATLTEFPATLTPKKRGVYKLSGTATNAAGTAGCEAEFTVGRAPGTRSARGDDSRWTARFFGLRLDPDDGSISESLIRPDGVSERSHLNLDGGVGGGAGLEYHFNPRIGLEGSLLYVPLESELFFDLDDEWESAEDDVEMLAFLIGPNFHLTPDKKVDFYIGLFVGAVDLGSTSYRVLGETQNRSFDADTVFGAQLGLDIPFGKGDWAVHLGVRYMDMTVETREEGPELAADPLGFEVGFAYSF